MLFDLVGKGLGLIGKLLGANSKVAEAVNTIQDALNSSPEAQAELKRLQISELEVIMQSEADVRKLYGLEVKSKHKFVAYARPAMLWVSGGILALNFGMLPVLNAVAQWFGAPCVTIVYPELPESVYWAIAGMYTAYGGYRSVEKVKGKS